ncbi:MAG: SGNH/GDSL hydrolase family protein [Acidimicrobiia bacterium]|nr:SGNH/GDSL hydrolase family protein [Acidimicrobiia bacterium]
MGIPRLDTSRPRIPAGLLVDGRDTGKVTAARGTLIGVLAVLAVACSGGEAPPPATTTPAGELGIVETGFTGDNGPTVVVLGDSIAYRAIEALHEALDGDRVRIAALIGQGYAGDQTTASSGTHLMVDIATVFAPLNPDVVVFALGTNDAIIPESTIDEATAAMRSMDALFPSACLVGVGVNEAATLPGFDTAEARGINLALTEIADQFVDISPLAASSFEPDGIHPPPEAVDNYAALVADAVDRCVAS